MFFDGYKRENVVKYRKIFLSKMKSLLAYFVKFSDNESILSKV